MTLRCNYLVIAAGARFLPHLRRTRPSQEPAQTCHWAASSSYCAVRAVRDARSGGPSLRLPAHHMAPARLLRLEIPKFLGVALRRLAISSCRQSESGAVRRAIKFKLLSQNDIPIHCLLTNYGKDRHCPSHELEPTCRRS